MSTHDFYENIFTTHEEADELEWLLAGLGHDEEISMSVAHLKRLSMRIRQLEREVKEYDENSTC